MINRDPDVRFLIRSGSDFGHPTLTFQILVRDPALGPLLEEYRSDSSELGPARQAGELKETLDELANLKRREEKAIEIAERRLASIGTTLFRELPDKLQDRLWWLVGRAETFQIISNELSIPWELMMLQKPRSSGWPDGRFLCEAFAVTRWLHKVVGSNHLPARNIAIVVPQDSGLLESESEKADLLLLAGPARRVQEVEPAYLAVTEALRSGNYDAWHFCGHGRTDSTDPNRTTIQLLKGKTPLRPDDIQGHGDSFRDHKPLVFFNACETGVGGFSLMDLGGWAPSLLGAGAGAFLGTLWSVEDHAARAFAREFYRLFLGGEPIAEALRRARLHIREEFPGDSSWLAYTAYAHPFATQGDADALLQEQPRRLRESAESSVSSRDGQATAPDLEIWVRSDSHDGKHRLRFILHSPSGAADFFNQEIAGPVFASSPEDWLFELMGKIRKLNKGVNDREESLFKGEAARWMANIGRRLYQDLFPPEMKYAYRRIRKIVRTIMLVAEAPGIPWELVKPYDTSDLDNIIDDDFLCLRFQLTRWLSGAKPPLQEIRVQRYAFWGSEASSRYRDERSLFRAFAGRHSGVDDMSPTEPTMKALEDLLGIGGVQLLHFARDFKDLAFRPEYLHSQRLTKIRRDRPLVFFNLNYEHVELARLWVEDCGCGAFLYPMLNINQENLAYEFAANFYGALDRGETFGQAGLEARRRLYALDPGIPAWFAYNIYAHVNGRLRIGDS